jgi:hypothetical protein
MPSCRSYREDAPIAGRCHRYDPPPHRYGPRFHSAQEERYNFIVPTARMMRAAMRAFCEGLADKDVRAGTGGDAVSRCREDTPERLAPHDEAGATPMRKFDVW